MENESSPGKRSVPALTLWEARWRIFGELFLIAYLIDGFFGMSTGASGVRGGSALFVPILSVFAFIFALRKILLPQHVFLILPLFQFLLVILPVAPPTWPVWPLVFIQLILGTYGLYALRPVRTPDIDRISLEKERARAYGWIFLVAYLIDGFAGVFSPLTGSGVRAGSILSVIIISVFVLTFALRKTLLPQHVFLILPLFQLLSVINFAQKWLTGFVWPLSLIQGALGIYGVYVFRSAKDASRLKEQPRSTRESMSYIFLGIIFICVVTLYVIHRLLKCLTVDGMPC